MNYRNDNPPIMCDMTGAADTIAERMAEYQRLFVQSLLGRDRSGTGIRFRFRADQGLADWVRDLAAREKACCAFFSFTVTAHGDEVWWDASVVDDDTARQVLDEFYRLPDTLAASATGPRRRRLVADNDQPDDAVVADGEVVGEDERARQPGLVIVAVHDGIHGDVPVVRGGGGDVHRHLVADDLAVEPGPAPVDSPREGWSRVESCARP